MKLIGSGLFIIIGVIIAILITRHFGKKSAGYAINIVVGVVAALAGIWVKDALDIQLLGNTSGAVVFSALGALIALIPLNLIYGAGSKNS